ncbi:DEHA2A12408p [Debaryomyces hansenii CBS767]|uniref:DEHA2A12408p n=1 Tax=Debaryomyces hansenii (strain ATCC 36239 / CBS 767 / BCRC 21394 / JCM 1990 / NBRC 0083 / IGC 2968) TaxID=284592 RepID=B5RSV1_DEBHA|nr:DEHA2A12408p [Debaryomyces hansenii CBS767]CAR65407.1 DEHA2A12408p [Debaryomyces hansenii CBS767]|eukprot:XP_002770030.1 DEHA2A12408p [Debaryomyces hansenii CBS767]
MAEILQNMIVRNRRAAKPRKGAKDCRNAPQKRRVSMLLVQSAEMSTHKQQRLFSGCSTMTSFHK